MGKSVVAGMLVVTAIVLTATSLSYADPPATIDWRQFDELIDGPGNHVVGEELCVRRAPSGG